jgi:hypothetical protein
MSDRADVALSLISHTNAGKTTLARTLLDRDIGEVRDAAHVTQEASIHTLVETPEGDRLSLWDTPGFGDSARLAKRLAQQNSPVGWFLTHVWDRYRDRAFWLTQKAVRNVRDDADVVLYLVNVSEAPEDAGYLAPELAVLACVGKPVIALLNQTGIEDAGDEARWRERLGAANVGNVLPLDAFARCWVQELALFEVIARVLPERKQAAFGRLAAAWQARRRGQFDAAMEAIAATVARAACDRVTLPQDKLLTAVGRQLGIGRSEAESSTQRAEREMAMRIEADFRACTDRLIEIHRLKGNAEAEALIRRGGGLRREAPVDEGKATLVGGIVGGALTGLGADLAAGGLTLGGGMLAGALLGALGGAGVAHGMNLVRERTHATLAWDDAFLRVLAGEMLLRYLTVAHFGRGRGDWKSSEPPARWREQAQATIEARRADLTEVFVTGASDAAAVEARLRPVLKACGLEVLDALYRRPPQ